MTGEPEQPGAEAGRIGARRGVYYPTEYSWLVFLAAMDVMLTLLIIHGLGGSEANPIALWVLNTGGPRGMIVFKFAAIVLVVLICEFIGRRRFELGRRLARVGVGISAIPIVVAALQLLRVILG